MCEDEMWEEFDRICGQQRREHARMKMRKIICRSTSEALH